MFVKLTILNLVYTIIDAHNFNNNYLRDDVRVRAKFLDKKKQNEKIELYDEINSNTTVFLDDILHMKSANNSKVSEMEGSFRNMLAMKGVTYIFKRDFFWRTWRQVGRGNLTVVCYRCQNNRDVGWEKCQSGGYWVIEEKPPPCPYEVFSLKTDWDICAANYNQYPDLHSSCPSTINRLDLKSACDNPIKTTWRITKNYTDVSERNSVYAICQGRENCELSTLYTIALDSIVFRIINSSNNIIYSRVMKSGNRNYVCIDDCGKIDPKTNIISKNEQPYRLDLFKNKRQDMLSMTPVLHDENNTFSKKNKDLTTNSTLNKKKKYHENPQRYYTKNPSFSLHMDAEKKLIKPKKNAIKNSITKSPCKKLQEKYFDIDKENYIDYK